ncbi:MAG: hypothetical protein ACXVRQ_01735 [Gaiellaceae bacterium]
MLGLGIAAFVVVHNGHRVGSVLVLVGIVCLVIGLGVRRAGAAAGAPRVVVCTTCSARFERK